MSQQPRRSSLDQLRKQAKELLRQFRAGDEVARQRFAQATPRSAEALRPRPVLLADAQFVIARELGYETWATLKSSLQSVEGYLERYQRLAEDIVLATQDDQDAAMRLDALFGGGVTSDRLRSVLIERLGLPSDTVIALEHGQSFVARLYGFESWNMFTLSLSESEEAASQGISVTPPFYKIDRKANSLEPRPPISTDEWNELFEIMRDNGITGLRTNRMTDAILALVARLDFITSLHLEGSQQVSDAGLRNLAQMPQLQHLNLTGCGMTDSGLSVLGQLPELRRFELFHHRGVSDADLAHLASCHKLEKVDLLGCQVGDGVLRALVDKPHLRRLMSGDLVTDAGLSLLREFPVFRSWKGGHEEITLMGFEAEPNYLLLRGAITDQGLATLADLEGLFALNLDDSRLNLTSTGIRHLTKLPHLSWLGFDANDSTMGAIAELPHLRMLMCQDTSASDAGFTALSRSRSLEYLWGRRCHGLTGVGFKAMSQMPSLKGLSVSCLNVEDAALASLPSFPALTEFMPMDVPDAGFRHIGRCHRLEQIWCMYCRETGDVATGHLAGLPNLKSYYAGQTRITDRSLKTLGAMSSLERLSFYNCSGVTDAGVQALKHLPNLQELTLSGMSGVTRKTASAFRSDVRVNYE